ncbi:MAG: hypothetical protein ACO1PI_15600 [Bacteroidota bacterium]
MYRFNQQLAKYVIGCVATEDLPQIALTGLQEGLESESLIILGGMGSHNYLYEIETYFSKALVELNISLPNKREAALLVSYYYVSDISNGTIEPITGVGLIIQCLNSYDFFSESKNFVLDSVGFNSIYGLYYEYEDLKNPLVEKPNGRTEQEIREDLTKQIMSELAIWRTYLIKHELNTLPKSQ